MARQAAKTPRTARAARAAPAKRGRGKRTRSRGPEKSEDGPYHHGALHAALLKAAETVREREALAGLTLRAVAREAGVSHAAPAHHFGDLTGLLSELAAIGYTRFSAAMIAANAAGTPQVKAMASAKAYLA